MTSIATIAGAIPLVIGGGAGGAARASIGVVIVFGVALATLITLFLIPILYSRLAKRTSSPDAVGRELDAALVSEAPQPAE
jgi:multidrug efflux pump